LNRSKPIININRTGLKAAHEIFREETGNIYYIKGDDLLGKDTDSTVDGSHPSD
jgi:hypothetical protein